LISSFVTQKTQSFELLTYRWLVTYRDGLPAADEC